ncbi:MAG: fibronectin type III domain-containing protein, partial [Acidobacteria bacterium]|nr:fibronectin type III domain-containing protein [Acidobacteriota bacterium]
VNPWREIAVSPHTDTIYVHSFVQSTWGSTSWLESMRADTYATVHPRTVLTSTDSGMALLPPPGAPRHVRAQASGHNVTVNWTNIGAASEFVIDIGLSAGRTDLSVAVTGGNAHTAFANVPSGTYCVRVRGRNVIGTGRTSQQIAVTVP